MRALPLSQLARWCEGRLVGDDREVIAVETDSRRVRRDALFVALVGEHHDGHDFAADAAQAGAAAVLTQKPLDVPVPQILCADTLAALGEIAAGAASTRRTRVIGLTGSNGKTTVKTLTQAIMARAGTSYANPGNFNNEIGLPLALLDQPEHVDTGIYEMGAGKPGDIAYLAAIARPSIALVNNVMPAHLERMGSLMGVAETKGAIYDALPDDGVAVINTGDAFGEWFAGRAAPRRCLRFGIDASADVVAERIQSDAAGSRFRLSTPVGSELVLLPLPGPHNVMNALAAASLALAADASLDAISAGLAGAPNVVGRLTRHVLPGGAVVIDDSYNANPGSVAAAIATLALERGETWLVLGDMAELGAGAERLHAEIGERAKAAGIARLFAVGPLARFAARAFGANAQHHDSQAELARALRDALRADVVCLVKGSRSSAMERVVRALRGEGASAEVGHAA